MSFTIELDILYKSKSGVTSIIYHNYGNIKVGSYDYLSAEKILVIYIYIFIDR